MRVRSRALAIGVLMAAAAGCGNVCQRAEEVALAFAEKTAGCGGSSTSPGFDRTTCEASMSSCSGQEQATVWTYLDCVDALPVCQRETSGEFSEAFLRCANPMQQVSSHCLAQ